MTSDEYFDTRTLRPMTAKACPVLGCQEILQPYTKAKARPLYCTKHGIKIHSKTFGYSNVMRNIRFEREYFRRCIAGNPHKAETQRLGYENSEDALTWNVFARLAVAGHLRELVADLSGIELKNDPELFLWGLPISLGHQQSPETYPLLTEARKLFEPGISRMLTEPDIMLHVPGQCLMLIEAKFMSPNTVVEPDATDVQGEKPKSRAGILSRYSKSHLPAGALSTDELAGPFFSQLYRNLVFAIWMSNKLGVDWRLISLVSKQHSKGQADPTPFVYSLLQPAARKNFVRYDWETLYRDHVRDKPDLTDLSEYLQYKSANCGRGLAID